MNPWLDNIIDKVFRDKKHKLVIVQSPNLPIISFLLFSLLSLFFRNGNTAYFVRALSFGSLFTWCWLEIFQGVNLFRRMLGLFVLISSTLSIVAYIRFVIK